MRSSRLLLLLMVLAFGLSRAAQAQLDLPKSSGKGETTEAPRSKPEKKPKRQSTGNLVRHLVCTVCYERNYTASLDTVGKDGMANVYCKVCRRPTYHKQSEMESEGAELDLPSGGGGQAGGTPGPAAEPSDEGESSRPATLPAGVGMERAATFIFDEVKKTRSLNDTLALQAVDSLVALGETGFGAARSALFEDNASICMCAARVLLRSPNAADRDLVVQRIRGRMPNKVAPRLITEIVEADPVHGTPKLLAQLLDHPQTPVRNAAFRQLANRMTPELMDDVAAVLSSRRASSRERAVNLLAQLEDGTTDDLLLKHLGDPSASVAATVATTLALSSNDDLESTLLSIAFDQRWILREGSYALLAIIQREDADLKAILTETHAPALVRGMDSGDPFVAGTCATALAGIGFRSPDVLGTAWLEREVPELMVSTVSGKAFHADFASLQPHALRRLSLITGQKTGSDGPAWVRWWLANRAGFYAHRAHLFVDPDRVGSIRVHYRSLGATVELFNLIGDLEAKSAHANPPRPGEQIFLTRNECADLVSLLRDEGVLGAERLPGSLGGRGNGERTLEILIDGHGKKFIVGDGYGEPWFDRVIGAMRAMRARGAWQRYPDPSLYADSYAFWKAEKEWWAAEHTEAERALRLKSHVMAWLNSMRVTQRTPGITELTRIYAKEGVPQAADFAFFRDRLGEERFFGPRAGDLLALALTSARMAGKDGLVPRELGKELGEVLSATFGPSAAGEIAQVLRVCGWTYVREVADSEIPMMRSIAATVLVKSEDPVDREKLMSLLEDPAEEVQIAAMLAMGEHHIEEARTELLVRARFAQRPIRIAGLRSIALLGGEFVFDALVSGRSDPDPMVRAASVEGLAILGDPRAASLLITLLSKGEESPTYEVAWKGLLRMGEAAHTDLLQAMYSPTHRARKQATLLLARQLEPLAASTLIAMVTDNPGDKLLMRELAILTCVDFSAAKDAPLKWWDWWDLVVHDDSLAWFRGAVEREDRPTPLPECFRKTGNREGALFLVSFLDHSAPHLAERARRELEVMLDRDLDLIPNDVEERGRWIADLRQLVLNEWKT